MKNQNPKCMGVICTLMLFLTLSLPCAASLSQTDENGTWSENCLCMVEEVPCIIEVVAVDQFANPCIEYNPDVELTLSLTNVSPGSQLDVEIIYSYDYETEYLSFQIPDGVDEFVVPLILPTFGIFVDINLSIDNGSLSCSTSVSIGFAIPGCEFDCNGVLGGPDNPGTPCINEAGQTGVWSPECLCEVETDPCLADAGTIFTNSQTTVCENSKDLIKVRFSETPNMDSKSIGLITDTSPDPLVLAYFFAQPTNGFSFNAYAGNQFQIWVLNVEFPDQVLTDAAQMLNNGFFPPLSAIDGLCYDLSNPIVVTKTACINSGENPITEPHELLGTSNQSHDNPESYTHTRSTMSTHTNPSNGPSAVHFITATTGRTMLELFDLSGRKVFTLFNQDTDEGQEYRLNFDGTYLPNGVYIYRLTTGNEVIMEKLMIAK